MYQAPPLPDAMRPLDPSPHQRAIFEFIAHGQGSAIVTAVAGSGKTTTILHGLSYIAEAEEAILLAFNTAIAGELKTRISQLSPLYLRSFAAVQACTFHSLGYRAIRSQLQGVQIQVESSKMRQLCKDQLSWIENHKYGPFLCKLIGLAKGEGIGSLVADIPASWQALINHHDLILDEEGTTEDKAITLAQQLLKLSTEVAEDGLIDFDDQLYLVGKWDIPLLPVPWVFIDEAQDTNPVRRDLAERVLAPGGRLIAVGDRSQSIYGFNGASHDAIDLIKAKFHAIELPLTVSYRCARLIVKQAQQIVSHIQACEGQIEGFVEHDVPFDEAVECLEPSDVILCRTTAPLVEAAYQLIGDGVACTILGRDIAQGLVHLIRKLKPTTLLHLEEKLQLYRDREVKKFLAREQHSKAENIRDRVACIRTIADHLTEAQQSVDALIAQIERMFSDQSSVLTLSTVHKAKGKEWRRVAILRPDLMPWPWAKQAWQAQQEENLQYVAWTRAKEELYFLRVPPEKKRREDRG